MEGEVKMPQPQSRQPLCKQPEEICRRTDLEFGAFGDLRSEVLPVVSEQPIQSEMPSRLTAAHARRCPLTVFLALAVLDRSELSRPG